MNHSAPPRRRLFAATLILHIGLGASLILAAQGATPGSDADLTLGRAPFINGFWCSTVMWM